MHSGARSPLAWLAAALAACALTLPLVAAHAQEPVEPSLSLSATVGIGYMRGGHSGGLMTAQAAPMALDAQAMMVRKPRFLFGGALRMELTGVHGVAGILRAQLRHPFGPLELRPGAGLPFYFAPRTMLGPEVSLGIKLGLSKDLGILINLAAAAFIIGDDVPRGSTVIMMHAFVGIELFI
jgi:hypothetical protein